MDGYNEAVGQIKSMFSNFDVETIKTILSANNGDVEKSIDDLLKMTNENNNGNPDDDNLFADPKPKSSKKNDDLFGIDDEPQGNRFEDLGIFQDTNKKPKADANSFAGFDGFSDNRGHNNNGVQNIRNLQEQEDAAIAYRLQKEFMKEDQQYEQQQHQQSRHQKRDYNNQDRPVDETWDFGHPVNQNPQGNRQQTDSGDKKVPDILNKVKTSFNNFGNSVTSLFNKKKPTTKNQPSTNAFSEIENLDEQEVYSFSAGINSKESTGLHQLSTFKNKTNSDPALNLSDVLHAPSTNQNSGYGFSQQSNNSKNDTITNDYFNFS